MLKLVDTCCALAAVGRLVVVVALVHATWYFACSDSELRESVEEARTENRTTDQRKSKVDDI